VVEGDEVQVVPEATVQLVEDENVPLIQELRTQQLGIGRMLENEGTIPTMAEKKQLRAIVAKRLSHMTDATTHLVTETETIDEFVKRKNIKVWAEAEDLDVSGGKPIRERPKVGQLRNAVEAASGDDGWAALAYVGQILTNRSPDFDSRTWGYAKLSDLVTATKLFDMENRGSGEGKPGVIFIRPKRRQSTRRAGGRQAAGEQATGKS
jgi:OST-HTH/LOTUS domain